MTKPYSDVLRVGLVGFAGLGTQNHQTAMYLPALRDRSDVTITAVAASGSTDADAAGAAAADLGLQVEATTKGLLARDDVDAVVVCAAADRRADLILEAIAAGRHVLADKPMTLTLAEARRIRSAAADAGVVVGVAQHLRQAPLLAPLVGALRGGRVGLPFSVQADFVVAGGARVEGHELDNIGVYPVDIVQTLLGQRPLQVFASRAGGGECEAFVLAVDHDNGVTSTICVARTAGLLGHAPSAPVVHRYRVAGSTGTLSADLTRPAVFTLAADGQRRSWVDGSTVRACVDDFVAAVRAGRAPACTVYDAMVSAAVLEAARTSLDTGQPCPVDNTLEEA